MSTTDTENSGELRVGRVDILSMHQGTKHVQEKLQQSYETSKKLFESLQDPTLWFGQTKDEFMAYYHLLLQYHGCLAGITTGPYSGGGGYTVNYDCLKEMADALHELYMKLLCYPNNSNNYKQIREG